MDGSNAEATIYTERDGDAFAPGTSLARDHPDAAVTPRPPSRRRRSRLRSATASRRSSLRRLGTESLHDSSLERTGFENFSSALPLVVSRVSEIRDPRRAAGRIGVRFA